MEFLEVLEDRNSYQGIQSQSNENRDQIKHVTQRLLQLRRKRDALKNQLKSLDTMISENNVSVEDSEPESENEDLTDVKVHHDDLLMMFDSLRLTGFAVFSVEDNSVIFSYSTSYHGTCHETFYLEIQQNPNFQVTRHSFPGFIPVLELEQKILKDDPKQFLFKLSDYLFAYITRREEVNLVKKNKDKRLSITSTEPVDFVELKIGNLSAVLQLEFQLTYTDLLHTMPSKTRLTVVVNDDSEGHRLKPKQETVNQWKKSLQTELFSEAVFSILEDYNKITVYSFDD